MRCIKKLVSLSLILSIMVVPVCSFATSVSILKVKESGTPISTAEYDLTKKITNIDNLSKEITIRLDLNKKQNKQASNSEVLFLIDDSSSMETKMEDGVTSRKQKVVSSTEDLISKISSNTDNVKMSTASFSTGTQVQQGFTESRNALIKSLEAMKAKPASGNTNMATALSSSKKTFSSDADNKVLVLLTDGFPTDGADNTKAQLKDNDVYIISTLVGVDSSSQSQITSIFGTESNPQADEFHNISDANIGNAISNQVYKRIVNNIDIDEVNVNIKDYFPEDIINNFDITIVEKTAGDATFNGNVINWDIKEISKSKETYLTYKLKLKDDFNNEIVEKVLNTNQKVDLSYVNSEGNNEAATMNDSPQIKLTTAEVLEEENKTTEEVKPASSKSKKITTTTANANLPYTGASSFIVIAIIGAAGTAVFTKIKLNKLR